jgi:Flp pilus assembly protein TadD
MAMAAASSAITFMVQRAGGAVESWEALSLGSRLANAIVSYVSYVWKAIWPANLSVFYPHPMGALPGWQVAGAALVLIAATAAVIVERKRKPYLLVGWLWYIGTLIPVIGVVQVGQQAMADRYMYVPLIGLTIMLAFGIWELAISRSIPRVLLGATSALVLLVFAVASWRQASHWRDSLTLFEHANNVTERNWLAHTGLGFALADRRQLDEAISHYREAVLMNPNYKEARNGFGVALADRGNLGEAVVQYEEALRINPNFAEAHNNLAVALAREGKNDEAITHYTEALRLDPGYADAHNNLGVALDDLRKFDEALSHYQEAVRIKPEYAEAYYNMGITLNNKGKPDEAVAQYLQAVRVRPEYAEAHNNIGMILAQQRRYDEAITHYKEALRIKPDFIQARNNLETILKVQKGTD